MEIKTQTILKLAPIKFKPVGPGVGDPINRPGVARDVQKKLCVVDFF